MHSLGTLKRLNDAAAQREAEKEATAYATAVSIDGEGGPTFFLFQVIRDGEVWQERVLSTTASWAWTAMLARVNEQADMDMSRMAIECLGPVEGR